MSAPPRRRLYAAVFLASLATLVLEILLTRIVSVVAWYHMAFFIISLAMLGMTAGAVLVFALPDRFRDADVPARMTQGMLGFAITTPLVVSASLSLPLQGGERFGEFAGLFVFGVLLALPFVCSGVSLTLALTRAKLPEGTVYGVDLVGAALGCLSVVGLLAVMDAPSATLIAAALGAGAAALFGGHAGATRASSLLAVSLLAVGVLSAAMSPPLFRPVWVKGAFEDPATLSWVGWNTHSRISVSHTELKYPMHYGASPIAPDEALTPVPQRTIWIDGKAETRMFERGDRLDEARWADWDATTFVHRVRPHGPAAVIGVGGGRDVIAAARAGHDPVVGIELNERILHLHRQEMAAFSGLLEIPALELHADEARGFMARETRRFTVITMSFIDTWAAGGAGAYSLSENGLYTVQGWMTFLDRLTDDGLFSVSRWYLPHAPGETARMVSVAAEALFRRGVTRPRDHLVLLSTGRFATLLVRATPFPPDDLARIASESAARGLSVMASPDAPTEEPLLAGILEAEDQRALWAFTSSQEIDLTPSTDDRPFFFNMLKPGTWLERGADVDTMDAGFLGNLTATRTLIQATLVSLLLSVIAIAAPLLGRRRELAAWEPRTLLAAGGYFACIGLGFLFVEIGLLSRLNVLLGHPTLALAVLLGGIILCAGIGSLCSGRIDVADDRVARLYPLVPAVLTIAIGLTLDPVQEAFTATSVGVRVLVGLALVGVPALGMGICFPLGLRLVGGLRRPDQPDLGPWLWAVNGASGVCASSLALGCSMVWGVSRTLAVGSAFYVALLVCTSLLVAARGR